MIVFFFVKQKTAYEMRISDWSSDVCSSDLIESESPELARFQPRALVRQLQASLARELDLAAECRNAERIAASFADEPALLVPTVHWPWTSERVHVQARKIVEEGKSVSVRVDLGGGRKLKKKQKTKKE